MKLLIDSSQENDSVVPSQQNWPQWWQWELDCSNPHLAKRMIDRSFSETDLREMLEAATAYRPDVAAGRWVIETMRLAVQWEVVVEPEIPTQQLIVVTAYPLT